MEIRSQIAVSAFDVSSALLTTLKLFKLVQFQRKRIFFVCKLIARAALNCESRKKLNGIPKRTKASQGKVQLDLMFLS